MARPLVSPSSLPREVIEEIATAVLSLEYGQVQVTIHDSRVVEISTTQKRRLAASARHEGDAPNAR